MKQYSSFRATRNYTNMSYYETLVAADYEITTLESSLGYPRWARELRRVTTRQGLWEYFTGEFELKAQPDWKDDTKYPDTVEGCALLEQDHDDYKVQKEGIRRAWAILRSTVGITVGRTTYDYSTPAEAFKAMTDRYKDTDYNIRKLSYNRMEAMRLSSNQTMCNFIYEIQSCAQDIIDAGGSYSDEQIIFKIGRSLPKRYDSFVMHHIESVEKPPKFNVIADRLVALERKFLERKQARGKKGS